MDTFLVKDWVLVIYKKKVDLADKTL